MNKMDMNKVSDEEMQDLFTESFEKIGATNNISEFECLCKRKVGSDEVVMEVMVTGLAGTATYKEAHECEIDGIDEVTISRAGDRGELSFERYPEEDYVLNTNDYVITYKSV